MDVKLGLTPVEEQRLMVYENRVLRRIFGHIREWWEAGEEFIMSFITCMLHQILLG
jgi:hypothetical protein